MARIREHYLEDVVTILGKYKTMAERAKSKAEGGDGEGEEKPADEKPADEKPTDGK